MPTPGLTKESASGALVGAAGLTMVGEKWVIGDGGLCMSIIICYFAVDFKT